MNAVQIQEIVRETIRQELAAFFNSNTAMPQKSADYVSPADEARIRMLARQNMQAKSLKKARASHAA